MTIGLQLGEGSVGVCIHTQEWANLQASHREEGGHGWAVGATQKGWCVLMRNDTIAWIFYNVKESYSKDFYRDYRYYLFLFLPLKSCLDVYNDMFITY